MLPLVKQSGDTVNGVVVAVGAAVVQHLTHEVIDKGRMDTIFTLALPKVFQITRHHNSIILNLLQIIHRTPWLGLSTVLDDL